MILDIATPKHTEFELPTRGAIMDVTDKAIAILAARGAAPRKPSSERFKGAEKFRKRVLIDAKRADLRDKAEQRGVVV